MKKFNKFCTEQLRCCMNEACAKLKAKPKAKVGK